MHDAIKLTLSVRETRQYADGWSYLDAWRDIGDGYLLTQRELPAPEQLDLCGPERRREYRIYVPGSSRGDNAQDVPRALEGLFAGTTCQHAHDCCGCWVSMVEAVVRDRANPNEWIVRVRSQQNY